jgi:hypothetical protein
VLNPRRIRQLIYSLVLAIVVATCVGYALLRSSCVPEEPLTISRNFIDLVQAGELERAYLLTDQQMDVGRTLATFEANIRWELRSDTFPTHRTVEFIGFRGGLQSCGNRLRRRMFGRKIDPDSISIDHFVGEHPFETRLTSDDKGQWRIAFFQSHAM